MSALDALIFGVRYLFLDATELAQRARVSFGRGFSLVDDEENKWTRIEYTLDGGDTGRLPNTADVLELLPENNSTSRKYEVVGAATTTTTASADINPNLGSTAIEIDDAGFLVEVDAYVTGRKDGTNWGTWHVRRSFVRNAGGSVAAGASTQLIGTADKQGTANSTPWVTPVIGWNTSTKFPKITVDSDQAATILWVARIEVRVSVG